MKKILFLLFVTVFGFLTSQAQEEGRLVISAGQLKHISLAEDMKVILIGAETMQDEVKGDMKVFEKLNVSVSGGSMFIRPATGFEKQTVYVVVSKLKTLTLGQNTQVTTEGILRSDEINVFVEDGSVARIKTTGEVNAFPLDSMEVNVRKMPIQPKPFAKGF